MRPPPPRSRPWYKVIRDYRRRLRGRLLARALSRHGIAAIADTRNGLLAVDISDYCISRKLLQNGSWDWPEILWLGTLLSPDSRLVVVGAHVGSVVIPLAKRSGARNVTVLEPSPANRRLLMLNLALNDVSHVVVHPVAASDTGKQLHFAQDSLNSGSSHVSSSGDIVAQATPLDTLLQDTDPIDLLVMDTEGFEVHAMRGATATLTRTRNFYVEFCPRQLREQGSTPAEFLDIVAGRFDTMHMLSGDRVQSFHDRTYVQHLNRLDEHRTLLNLLFSDGPVPQPPAG